MNYYQVLNISTDATDEQIKSAYKKMAKKYHPDVGGDSETFYKISQAYQTLIDPSAKQDYDYYNGFTNHIVDREQAYYESIKNRDIILTQTISIEDVFTGKTVIIKYNLSDDSLEKVTIDIPRGIKNNDILRVQEAGDNYIEGNPRGDLLIKIKVKNNKDFTRDGDNLIVTKMINALDLITGCGIVCEIPYYGSVDLDIPHGTQQGTIFSIPGFGFPNINTGKTGALYIKINAFIPSITEQSLVKQLETIKSHIAKDTPSGSKQRTTSSI